MAQVDGSGTVPLPPVTRIESASVANSAPSANSPTVNEHVPAWVPVTPTSPKLNTRAMERSNEPKIALGRDTEQSVGAGPVRASETLE